PGWWDHGQRAGFDLVDLSSRRKVRLAEARPGASWEKPAARFRFRRAGWRFGHKALSGQRLSQADYCLVDEVGPLELHGKGWAPRLDELAEGRGPAVLILVVRESLLEQVCHRWNWQVESVFEAGRRAVEDAAAAVLACCAHRASQGMTDVFSGEGSQHGSPDSQPDGNAPLSAATARAQAPTPATNKIRNQEARAR
ncbi:MAG: nucleoside-triphosphatase, partial [Bryobacteraceae bacterium]|nr:nucleoside-triphosphatase [Bryobacteraceae bacterium]